ncbi:MAG: hypothetical protein HKL90_03265 [Elusimicrobia bacterium]|nr:hypothetical protein [Elusimicrobiota bacterium]
MTGMALYVRFMLTLAVGLAGLGMVLTTIFETLLRDWDPSRDIRRWWRSFSSTRSLAAEIRAEDILQQLRTQRAVPATGSLERRREVLRAVSDVESRLAAAPSA